MGFMIGRRSALAAFACLVSGGIACAGPLGAAGGYGEFVFGDLTRSNTSERGAIAVGGNAYLNNMWVAGSESGGLVVGGDLAWNNGSLGTGAAYVGGEAVTSNVGLGGDSRIETGVATIDFQSAKSYLEGFSQAQYGPGDPTAEYDGYYWLRFGSADATGLQVVDVDAATMTGKGLQVAGGEGSTVIVNVLGDSASFSNMQVQLSGGILASNVLWNFVDATSVTLSGVSWTGTILAMKADVRFDNGQLTGALIAETLTGSGTILEDSNGVSALFSGDSRALGSAGSTPEPAGVVLLGTAVAIGLAAGFRRRGSA